MKILLVFIITLIFFNAADAQELKFFYHDLTNSDSINSIDDWKKHYLNEDDVDIYKFEKDTNSKMVSSVNNTGWNHEGYRINYKNIPIEFAMIKVHKRDGIIESINGEFYQNINLDVAPDISENIALEKAKAHINAELYIWESDEREFLIKTNQKYLLNKPKGVLVICKDFLNTENKNLCLAYKFEIYAKKPLSRSYVYVDAKTGKIIHVNSIIKHIDGPAQTRYSGTRTISTNELFSGQFRLRDYDNNRGNGIETYNMNNGSDYSAATDFIDNDNNWTAAEYDNTDMDNAALDAHWGAMMTYDYFNQVHDRNSVDNLGLAIRNFVHADLPGIDPDLTDNNNAFWDGAVITYGDGGTNGFDVVTCIDIVAHEISHGVTQFSANLLQSGEAGALNEGVSDIFAACVENFIGGASFSDIWSIEEDIVNPPERLMWHPNSSSQPDTYYGTFWNASGEPHTNAGVLNYWFYLLSSGGSGSNDNGDAYLVSGIGINNAEQIIYRALTEYFTPNTNYIMASLLTIAAAKDTFGPCSNEVIQTINAWEAVGLQITDPSMIPYDVTVSCDELLAVHNGICLMPHPTLSYMCLLPLGPKILVPRPYTSRAQNEITANCNINSNGTRVTFIAGNRVSLTQGFRSGDNFKAFIDPNPCIASSNKVGGGNGGRGEVVLYPENIFLPEINDEIKKSVPIVELPVIKPEITLTPNPGIGIFNLRISKLAGDKNRSSFMMDNVIIENVLGEVVFQSAISNPQSVIDLSSHPPGLYFVKVITGDPDSYREVFVQKLIIQ